MAPPPPPLPSLLFFFAEQFGVGTDKFEFTFQRECRVLGLHLKPEIELACIGVAADLQDEGLHDLGEWGDFNAAFKTKLRQSLVRGGRERMRGDAESNGDGAFVDDAHEVLIAHGVRRHEVGRAGHAGNGHGCRADGGERKRGGHGANEKKYRVNDYTRAQPAGALPGKAVGGIIADEAARTLEFVHHLVAGVHAGGAGDTLDLQSLADVDAGGADLDAALAVDAGSGVWCSGTSTRFAALRVVADDKRVVVDEHGLKASIRADDEAELFAEPGEVEIQNAGGDGHKYE